jgi:hypothetical protein
LTSPASTMPSCGGITPDTHRVVHGPSRYPQDQAVWGTT